MSPSPPPPPLLAYVKFWSFQAECMPGGLSGTDTPHATALFAATDVRKQQSSNSTAAYFARARCEACFSGKVNPLNAETEFQKRPNFIVVFFCCFFSSFDTDRMVCKLGGMLFWLPLWFHISRPGWHSMPKCSEKYTFASRAWICIL